MTLLWLVHLASTLVLTGLIWTVQVVQYPLFARVGADAFAAYHAGHTRRIAGLVGPLMLAEAATASWLVVERPDVVPAWACWLGLALVAVIWLSTALLQVPRHGMLGRGFDADAHRVLVASNWLRTAAWSVRSVLVLWATSRLLRG